MKRVLFLCPLLVLLLSCIKEDPGAGQDAARGQITIRAVIPADTDTKVGFADEEGKLKLSWKEGDCIRVISTEASEVFTLSRLISAHEAEFTGPSVSGTSFDILCPGTYSGIDDAEADTDSPSQDGNGSTEHLGFRALLSGVDQYTDISFKQSWASAHGGSLKQGAAVKIVAVLPDGVTALKRVGIGLGGKTFSLPLKNVDVSASAQTLTAYMMLPWNDIALPDGSEVPLYVMDSADEVYSRTLSISGNKTVMQGKVNSFGGTTAITGLALQDFVAGDGSEENPYLIANARQLNNMHNSGVLVAGETKHFRLLEDIDASTIANWTPLNIAAPFDKGIGFDGDGHIISALTSTGVTYASFAGVLYGSISNVTFSGATINGGSSKCGVVAGFLGTTANDYARVATCTNVTVTGSSVTSTGYAAGFAGHIRGKGAVTGCKVINTVINGTSYVGGFAGQADITGIDKYEVPATFTDCEVDGVTLNQNQASASTTLYTGGFVGYTYHAHSFVGCKVKGTTITATKAAVSNIGGFVGGTDYAGANFIGCEVDAATKVQAKATNVGGFVGYAQVADAYKGCTSAATVTNDASAVGGFAGWACGSASFTDCHATGNVTGQRFTAGFAGVAQNASFTDCSYSGGTVKANTTNTNARVGGFVGSAIAGLSFQGCQVKNATLDASTAGRVGGFAGQLGDNSAGGNNVTVRQCKVLDSSIDGAINSGGFSGVQYESTAECGVEGGSITAHGNNTGGFTGYIQHGNLTNCYTTASITGGSYSPVGGFIGVAYTTSTSYCYAAGSVSGSGEKTGAFIGQCAKQGTQPVADITKCIAWHASLPFCASNTVGATVTDVYAGTGGSVSSQAQGQTWPTAVWDLSASLPALKAAPSRIAAIFVGDSITWQWARNSNTFAQSNLKIPVNSAYMTTSGSNVTVSFHPGFFSGNGYIDKGVSGQNTTQMLSRFQRDVVDQNPLSAVIMGGTNDLAQGVTKEQIRDNIAAMASMAKAAGINVVLCSVTPNNDSYSKLNDPKTKGAHIIALNTMIKALADAEGYKWCDYWTSLVADDGLSLKEAYRLYDNLHPGPDGYDVMEPIIKGILDTIN